MHISYLAQCLEILPFFFYPTQPKYIRSLDGYLLQDIHAIFVCLRQLSSSRDIYIAQSVAVPEDRSSISSPQNL